MSLPPESSGESDAPPPPPPSAPMAAPPVAPPPPPGSAVGQYAPTAVPPGMYYDPASQLVLPEGTVLAPVGRRIGSYFLSILLAIVTLFIGYLIWGAITWSRGQTPTQSVLGMYTWKADQQKVATWGTMALREIVGGIVEGILGFITQIISFVLF